MNPSGLDLIVAKHPSDSIISWEERATRQAFRVSTDEMDLGSCSRGSDWADRGLRAGRDAGTSLSGTDRVLREPGSASSRPALPVMPRLDQAKGGLAARLARGASERWRDRAGRRARRPEIEFPHRCNRLRGGHADAPQGKTRPRRDPGADRLGSFGDSVAAGNRPQGSPGDSGSLATEPERPLGVPSSRDAIRAGRQGCAVAARGD
jgi:hypothetical protein